MIHLSKEKFNVSAKLPRDLGRGTVPDSSSYLA
jgi:hypothetical protein